MNRGFLIFDSNDGIDSVHGTVEQQVSQTTLHYDDRVRWIDRHNLARSAISRRVFVATLQLWGKGELCSRAATLTRDPYIREKFTKEQSFARQHAKSISKIPEDRFRPRSKTGESFSPEYRVP